MSRSRRFNSEILPAPSKTTGLYEASRRRKAFTASVNNCALLPERKYSRADIFPTGLPFNTTCEVWSVEGFSNTGFISVWGIIPHASACTACALPISPPSGVEKEFKDIFCALKGAGRYPSCRNIRQKAVLRMLFPASEQVPTNITGRNLGFPSAFANRFPVISPSVR